MYVAFVTIWECVTKDRTFFSCSFYYPASFGTQVNYSSQVSSICLIKIPSGHLKWIGLRPCWIIKQISQNGSQFPFYGGQRHYCRNTLPESIQADKFYCTFHLLFHEVLFLFSAVIYEELYVSLELLPILWFLSLPLF